MDVYKPVFRTSLMQVCRPDCGGVTTKVAQLKLKQHAQKNLNVDRGVVSNCELTRTVWYRTPFF